MNEFLDRKPFVRALISVLTTALARFRTDDAEAVLGGIRVLRPNLVELGMFEAVIAIQRSQWREGIQVLNDLDAVAPGFLLGKAWMALSKFAVGDSGWQVHANEILDADPHGEAAQFLQSMMGEWLGESMGRSVPGVEDMPPWPDFTQSDLYSAQHAGYRLA